MPKSTTISLTPKGKQGKAAFFSDIPDLGLDTTHAGVTEFLAAHFAPTSVFYSYEYGLHGQPTDYTISGGSASEYLVIGDGNDHIYMGGGDDIVVAGGGNDFVDLGTGFNIADGGDGADTFIMTSGYVYNVDMTAGTATDDAGTILDLFVNFENVAGNALDNVIIGDDGANYISTGAGADTVYGGGGSDQIDAATQYGDKVLVGGTGDDFIFAGNGSDEIHWASGDGTDTVYYFDTTADAANGGDMLVANLVGDQGSDVATLVADGYLQFYGDGNGNTVVEVDADGGGDGFETAFIIEGTNYVDDATSIALFQGNITDGDLPIA